MQEISKLDWSEIAQAINQNGFAHLKKVLLKEECQQLQVLYDQPGIYRNVINMQRYRFGRGEYKYFSYPLPSIIQQLRTDFYPALSGIANEWMQKLSIDIQYPSSHKDFIAHCHSKNQVRPTPLILKYEPGGFNTLHQDLYGEVYFPFQIVFVLTQKGVDHTGGELVFTEQIPRAQSKATVIQPDQGDAIVFTTNFRPINGIRGYYRAAMKHGVSEVTSGKRFALGIIFHDAN